MQPSVVRDVVVVLPGIMGSELIDRDGRAIWSTKGRGLLRTIGTFGRSVGRYTLPTDIGDDPAPDGVRPGGLLPALHVLPGLWRPIAGYSGLVDFLAGRRFHLLQPSPDDQWIPNLIPFPYDWRLSCRLNARRLSAEVVPVLERWRAQPGMGDAKLVLVCHSMGGLVARWFLEQEGGAELTRALVTVGTPHRGAARAYATLANGLDVGVGRLSEPLEAFARSLPSLHQLLPQYRCLVRDGRRVTLAEAGHPGLESAMANDAAAFHAAIAVDTPPAYGFHKVIGIRQTTVTTVTLTNGEVRTSPLIDDLDQGGDGTVPRLAAEPMAGRGVEVHYVADQHGELHGARSVLDLLDGIITRRDLVFEGDDGAVTVGVATADVHPEHDDVPLVVTGGHGRRMRVRVRDESGKHIGPGAVVGPDGSARLEPLPPGAYRAEVLLSGSRSALVLATHPFLVWPAGGVPTIEDS